MIFLSLFFDFIWHLQKDIIIYNENSINEAKINTIRKRNKLKRKQKHLTQKGMNLFIPLCSACSRLYNNNHNKTIAGYDVCVCVCHQTPEESVIHILIKITLLNIITVCSPKKSSKNQATLSEQFHLSLLSLDHSVSITMLEG